MHDTDLIKIFEQRNYGNLSCKNTVVLKYHEQNYRKVVCGSEHCRRFCGEYHAFLNHAGRELDCCS